MLVSENYYSAFYAIKPNKYGLTHILHDKIKDQWFIVHATNTKFPAKYHNGIVSGIIEFRI